MIGWRNLQSWMGGESRGSESAVCVFFQKPSGNICRKKRTENETLRCLSEIKSCDEVGNIERVANGPWTEISFPYKGICVPKSAEALSTLPGINLL